MNIKSAIIGLCAGVALTSAYFLSYNRSYTGIRDYDYNGDGAPDAWITYKSDVAVNAEEDLNYDGKIDERHTYADGVIAATEADTDFDGRTDSWVEYSNGVPKVVRIDLDQDQEPDLVEHYQGRQIIFQEWLNRSDVVVKKASFRLGVKTEELIDVDEDGDFDRRITFDLRENPTATAEMKDDAQPEN